MKEITKEEVDLIPGEEFDKDTTNLGYYTPEGQEDLILIKPFKKLENGTIIYQEFGSKKFVWKKKDE